MKLLVIGGSDAGISAGLRARELKPETEVTMILADRYPNFSICGLPFYLSGEITDWRNLAHRSLIEIEKEGITVMTEHKATAIDSQAGRVSAVDSDGKKKEFSYDKLVIATGAISSAPDIPGINLPGVFLLRWMADGFAIQKYLTDHSPKSIVIIGAGYIGMEMADAMTRRGLSVTVLEYFPSVLTTLDVSLGLIVQSELERHGVKVRTGIPVTTIEKNGNTFVVKAEGGFEAISDMVLVAAGSRPESILAQSAGIEVNRRGAIRVNQKMETHIPNIYAAGDCAETYHRLMRENVYMPLGTTAHKQGRIAGENAVGGNRKFAGSLGTQSVKIFDLVAARTGLKEDEARQSGFHPLSVDVQTWDHKLYYPGAKKMTIRLTGDSRIGRMLGVQIVGEYGAEISKRIDIVAAAIFHEMKVSELSELDMSYTPPLSSPWDPVQMAAQAWERAVMR